MHEIFKGFFFCISDDGISIPREYTSFLAPLSSSKLWNETRACKEVGKIPEVSKSILWTWFIQFLFCLYFFLIPWTVNPDLSLRILCVYNFMYQTTKYHIPEFTKKKGAGGLCWWAINRWLDASLFADTFWDAIRGTPTQRKSFRRSKASLHICSSKQR